MVHTLNQRLRSFQTESRAERFLQCRQDYSLPYPINRGGFHGLKRKKIEFKVDKKPTTLPCFSLFLSSLSLLSPSQLCLQLPSSPPHFSLSTNCFSLFLHSGSSLSVPPFSFSSFSSIGNNNISTDLHRHHRLDHHHLYQPCSSPAVE